MDLVSMKQLVIKRKTIFIIIAIAIVALVVFVAVLLFRNRQEKVLLENHSVEQKSLPTTPVFSPLIDIKNASFTSDVEYEIYEITNNLKLSFIEILVSKHSLKPTDSVNMKFFYMWEGEGKVVRYDANTNVVTIVGRDMIELDSTKVDNMIFSKIAKEYFGEDWEYSEITEEMNTNKDIIYLAKRKLGNGSYVEVINRKNETDRMTVDSNGKFLSGSFLVASFRETGEYVTLVSKRELIDLIKKGKYPKEFLLHTYSLPSDVSMKLAYDAESYRKLKNSASNCSSKQVEVVYYYKGMEQKWLLPVYKVNAECEVNLDGETYVIPATMFVNAVEQKYIKPENKK